MSASRRAILLGLAALAVQGHAQANESTDSMPALHDSMAKYAQPIRVGDLARRYVIAPTPEQAVLGTVAPVAAARSADGSVFVIIDWGGLFGFGTTRVAVPLEEVAALGEHVALVAMPQPQLSALRRYSEAEFTPLPADLRIQIMIVGPFH